MKTAIVKRQENISKVEELFPLTLTELSKLIDSSFNFEIDIYLNNNNSDIDEFRIEAEKAGISPKRGLKMIVEYLHDFNYSVLENGEFYIKIMW